MKKRSFKLLELKKKPVSNLNPINGGYTDTVYVPCNGMSHQICPRPDGGGINTRISDCVCSIFCYPI